MRARTQLIHRLDGTQRDGVRDDATVRHVLTDPNVVEMLYTYTSLELKAPNDFIGYLAGSCTFAEQGVDVTTGD